MRWQLLMTTMIVAAVLHPMPVKATNHGDLPIDGSWDIWLSESPELGQLPQLDVIVLDLFDTTSEVIDALHQQGTTVICYFSAGSAENWRPDFPQLKPHIGRPVRGWRGEWWLDVHEPEVRVVMAERIRSAADKGCDGVDPDNVDGFQNATGLAITQQEALEYLQFLAIAAHQKGLKIGLKNALDLVPELVGAMDFAVNEQCLVYRECGALAPFVVAGKPVLHIEYGRLQRAASRCRAAEAFGFVTLVKHVRLDHRGVACG